MLFEFARLLFLVTQTQTPRVTDKLIRTILCIAISAIIALVTTILKKNNSYKHYHVILMILFSYISWTTWAFFTSYSHYKIDEQIITFYTTIFVFVCFINMNIKLSFPLITVTFISCYIMLYNTNKAENINKYNFFVMYFVIVFASILKYHYKVSQTKSRLRVMKMNDTLKNVSRYDYITQSRNRYALNDDLHKYVGRNIFIIVCDIDYLKFYNDKYGHVVGDKIIAAVAKIEKEIFEGAHVYRYGGDEFIILGDAISPQTVENKINALQEKISNTHVEGVEESIYCSFGHVIADINSSDDIEHYIAEADKELYKNKKQNHEKIQPILFEN